MLYPKANAARTVLDLSGIWEFSLKGDGNWQNIAVPASYNDQNADPAFRKYAGISVYRTKITVPRTFAGQRIILRFDAVAHNARVCLNGQEICTHRGGYLPFETEITNLLAPGETGELTVEADNRINHSTLPIGTEGATAFFGSDNPGIIAVEAGKQRQRENGINLPAFDFFNYTGINRPVRIYTTPKD